jgi:hypothetical protein
MARSKKTLGSTKYTRTGLIDTMNQLRSKTDRIILNLIYNPNSNTQVLEEIRGVKAIVRRLPNVVISENLFDSQEGKPGMNGKGGPR